MQIREVNSGAARSPREVLEAARCRGDRQSAGHGAQNWCWCGLDRWGRSLEDLFDEATADPSPSIARHNVLLTGMRVRTEQLRVFSAVGDGRFAERLVDFLRMQFSDASQESYQELLDAVHSQVARARGHGLYTEQEIAKYVVTAWILGADFATEFPAAALMLARQDLTAAAKADWLSHFTLTLLSKLENNGEATRGDG